MFRKYTQLFLRRRKYRTFLAVMVATGVVFFWRGTWGLMDLYIFPSDPRLSYLISIAVGLLILKITHRLLDELM